jgi:hypothetical protein
MLEWKKYATLVARWSTLLSGSESGFSFEDKP